MEKLAGAAAPPTHEEGFYSIILRSNEVFAAFKVHAMGMEMASMLHDADGELNPFSGWLKDGFSSVATKSNQGFRPNTTRLSSVPTPPTGVSLSATKMSCPTSGGCQPHPRGWKPHAASFGKRDRPSLSMTLSGNLTTRATDGTVSARSKPPMPPLCALPTSRPQNHSADLRTVQIRMYIYIQ